MPLPQEIIDFYLTRSPYAKSDKPDSRKSINLSTYGWEKANLENLMKWILLYHLSDGEAGGLSFSIATHIDNETVERFCCVDGPDEISNRGGAFCISRKIAANEDNSIKCTLSETYATCFFRHIRNSIAHGNYEYCEDGGWVIFRDQASSIDTNSPQMTAVFHTSVDFLLKLVDTVKNGPASIPDGKKLNDQIKGNSYRINRDIQAQVSEINA